MREEERRRREKQRREANTKNRLKRMKQPDTLEARRFVSFMDMVRRANQQRKAGGDA